MQQPDQNRKQSHTTWTKQTNKQEHTPNSFLLW